MEIKHCPIFAHLHDVEALISKGPFDTKVGWWHPLDFAEAISRQH